jgi:hypothetical protein
MDASCIAGHSLQRTGLAFPRASIVTSFSCHSAGWRDEGTLLAASIDANRPDPAQSYSIVPEGDFQNYPVVMIGLFSDQARCTECVPAKLAGFSQDQMIEPWRTWNMEHGTWNIALQMPLRAL